MQTTFETVNVPGMEIFAASVTHQGHEFRINVTKSHNNLPSMAWVFEIADGDGFYTDIVGKGFGPDAETTMRRSVAKVREIAYNRNAELITFDIPAEAETLGLLEA